MTSEPALAQVSLFWLSLIKEAALGGRAAMMVGHNPDPWLMTFARAARAMEGRPEPEGTEPEPGYRLWETLLVDLNHPRAQQESRSVPVSASEYRVLVMLCQQAPRFVDLDATLKFALFDGLHALPEAMASGGVTGWRWRYWDTYFGPIDRTLRWLPAGGYGVVEGWLGEQERGVRGRLQPLLRWVNRWTRWRRPPIVVPRAAPVEWPARDGDEEALEYVRSRPLCEDGSCLGVLRPISSTELYRGGPGAECPECGRRFPLPERIPRFWRL